MRYVSSAITARKEKNSANPKLDDPCQLHDQNLETELEKAGMKKVGGNDPECLSAINMPAS